MANEEILTKENIMKMKDGDPFRGKCLIHTYELAATKTGGTYIKGSVQGKGEVSFRVWSNASCYNMFTDSTSGELAASGLLRDKVCTVSGNISIYGGVTSLIINRVVDVDEDANTQDFYVVRYNKNAYFESLLDTIKKYTTEKGFMVADTLISPYVEEFMNEYASVSHHDNCSGGLLAHTTKVVKLCTVLKMYDNIWKKLDLDLLFCGCLAHDIGKIREYNNGVISDMGKVLSHPCMGVMIVTEMKDKIVELKGEEFFWRLCAVINQHSGEWGERPRAKEAYVVHLLDFMESKLTSLNEALEGLGDGAQFVFETYKLS